MSQSQAGPAYPWQGSLLLDEGETIRYSWRGNHCVMERGQKGEMVEARKPGYLVVTSKKVVFMEERGLFHPSYYLDCAIELESIGGIAMGGMLMKYVSIGGTTGENKYHLDGIDEKTFPGFRDTILNQIQTRKEDIEKERTRTDVQAMLDFSILRDYMTKGGISVQSIKCPQCKAPLTMPENGSFVKCTYCGSTVYASDIMDRVKQLIG